jgi:hypothetical protein
MTLKVPKRADSAYIMAAQEYDQETKDYEVARHAVFWSDEGSKTLYKNHVKCGTVA